MKELTLHYLPATAQDPPRIRVGYRASERAQAQEREIPFSFTISDEDRRLL